MLPSLSSLEDVRVVLPCYVDTVSTRPLDLGCWGRLITYTLVRRVKCWICFRNARARLLVRYVVGMAVCLSSPRTSGVHK